MIRWTRCCQCLILCLLAGCHATAPRVVSLPAAPEPIIFKYFQPAPDSSSSAFSPPGTVIIHYFQPVAPRVDVPIDPPVMPAPSVPSYEALRQERLRFCIARFHATDPAERDALFFQIDAIDNTLTTHYAADMAGRKATTTRTSVALPALDMSRPVDVRGYTRKDGTYVRPSTRNYPK